MGFIFRELSTAEPIVDLRVFKDRNFAVGTVLMTIMGAVLYSATAALPLFLQNLLGYPAMQSGLAVSPRGIGAFLMMTLVGRMIGVIDSRVLISSGFFILGYATFLLSNITLQVGVGNIAWPNIITGAAMGLIFVPLTTTSMATLSNDKMGNATGLFNLMRNIGGGLGISIATTYLARDAQSRQSQLSAHLSFSDPAFQARFHAIRAQLAFGHNGAVADQMALGGLYRGLLGQATLLSFVDIFRWTALLCVCCIPIVWLIRRGRKPTGPVMLH